MSKSSVKIIEPSVMTDEEHEKYFQKNILLVSALMIVIPSDEKKQVQKWLKKITSMSSQEMKLRNDYIWFLLVQLENGRITIPFIENPPEGPLPTISKSVDLNIYKEILTAAHKRAIVQEEEAKNNINKSSSYNSNNVKYERPSNFLKNQPVPVRGFIFYGSCFSNQDD